MVLLAVSRPGAVANSVLRPPKLADARRGEARPARLNFGGCRHTFRAVELSSEERRVKLTLHYDGAAFHGWQVQPESRTVQAELEAALSRLTSRPSSVIGAGRTDSGVHATGQVASTLVPLKWTAGELRRALNAVLPDGIWVESAEEVPPSFHARYDAIARSYTYRVGLVERTRSPFLSRWCWPLVESIDRGLLGIGAEALMGEHSFAGFAKSGQPERGDRCIVHSSEWKDWAGAGVEFRVTANRFLHHMVRYLVGTMIDVARERRDAGDVAALLERKEGVETSPPAPPEGLFLTRVHYAREALTTQEHGHEVFP
jgi:tRNA pseudouridine38-40 synthase